MWLYKITNKTNGKAYVGATIQSVTRRFHRHCASAKRGKSTLIAQAIREFGVSAFTLEIIGEAKTPDELVQMEMDAIRGHRTLAPDGYNRTIGGEMVRRPKRGFHLSKEHRQKIGDAHRGVKETPEFCQKVSEGKRGKTHAQISKAARKRIATSLMGHSVSQETRRKISASLKARKGEKAIEEST